MGVFGIFKLKGFDPDVFEKELTQITKQISDTQLQIYSLKGKSKQWIYSVCKIFIALYVLIFAYTYQKIPKSPVARNKFVNFLRNLSNEQLIVLVGFPVTGYVVVYSINYVFKLSVGRRENHLRNLKKKHAQKIEELKKITNFNTTNELLNKYGTQGEKKKSVDEREESEGSKLPLGNQQPQPQNALQTMQQQQIIQRLQNLQTNPPVQSPRTFQDRLLDFFVGSDNNEATENRYALICKQCLTHNGLAPPGCPNPFEVSYVCPNCGFLNGEMDLTSSVNQLETEQLKQNELVTTPTDPLLGRPLIDEMIEKPLPENIRSHPVDATHIEPGKTSPTSSNRLAGDSLS